jgi:hypothetical protein
VVEAGGVRECSASERRAAWAPRVPVSLAWTLDVGALNRKSAHAPPDLPMSHVHVNVAGFRRDLLTAAPPPRGAYVVDTGAPLAASPPPQLGEPPRDRVDGRADAPPPPPALTLPEKARLLVDAVAASASSACRQAASGAAPPPIPQPLIRDGFAHITEGLPALDGALAADRVAMLHPASPAAATASRRATPADSSPAGAFAASRPAPPPAKPAGGRAGTWRSSLAPAGPRGAASTHAARSQSHASQQRLPPPPPL